MTFFYQLIRAIGKPLLRLIFPYKILHHRMLPSEGCCVLCCNHISLIDPAFLIASQQRRICFMAKEEIFSGKVAAWFLKKMGVFPVKRGLGDTEARDTSLRILEEKGVLGIFPEGTRSKTGELLRPKSGAMMFAARTASPIYPVAVAAKNGKVKPFHRAVICYGAPVTAEGLGVTAESSPRELRDASCKLMEIIGELREEALKAL